ncbi:hypothetical protein [Desulfurobacterium atlanticum]|nr:hypothetical protein [Desulfurobacterium atlanticum]
MKRDLLNRQCQYQDIRDVLAKHFDEISRIVERDFIDSFLCEEKCPVKKYGCVNNFV